MQNIINLSDYMPQLPPPLPATPVPTNALQLRIGDRVSFNTQGGNTNGVIIGVIRRAHLGKPDLYTVMYDGITRRLPETSLLLCL